MGVSSRAASCTTPLSVLSSSVFSFGTSSFGFLMNTFFIILGSRPSVSFDENFFKNFGFLKDLCVEERASFTLAAFIAVAFAFGSTVISIVLSGLDAKTPELEAFSSLPSSASFALSGSISKAWTESFSLMDSCASSSGVCWDLLASEATSAFGSCPSASFAENFLMNLGLLNDFWVEERVPLTIASLFVVAFALVSASYFSSSGARTSAVD
mmetsp:Transcript_13746/g.29025  ORF Transcript_13746/g.29025 Transcript_13746/m.29025 type:complete len:212 (-) Transcript_13746:1261-1896(-)